MLWLAVKDGSSFANGAGCYNWKNPVCPGPDFAAENYNYESTEWSWYTQYSCTSGNEKLETAAAALIASGTFAALFTLF